MHHAAFAAAPDDTSGGAAEPRISDATLFLFGGGLALLIALLAWGEQIRNIARDTRDLETSFLQSRGLTRAEFLPILKRDKPADQLVALTQLMTSGKLKTVPEVEVLGHFQEWTVLAARLAWLFSLKYWLTIALTAVLFIGGCLSAFLDLRASVVIGGLAHLLLMSVPAVLIAALLALLIAGARAEKSLNELLVAIGERV